MTSAMTCEQFQALLPRLLDDEIEVSGEMQTHLDGCAACRALVADLRTIEAGAAALPLLEPRRDLWSGIADRIEAPVVPLGGDNRSSGGRRQISWRVAGMAAAALVVVTTAITYQVTRRVQSSAPIVVASNPTIPIAQTPETVTVERPAEGSTSSATTKQASNGASENRNPAPARVVLANNVAARVDYDREILRLRAIVDSGRTRLDPATVALLERNLTIIDSAIVQCRNALARDPASKFLIESLSNAYQTKVKLLRIAAAASAG
jgi:hypothetical protein